MKKLILITSALLFGLFISTSFAAEVTLFGPNQYFRTTGKPNVYMGTFPGITGQGKLILKNGTQDGKNRISSALVLVNGKQVLGPSDFNQQVYNKEVPIKLSENNSISVELRSGPGGNLTIRVVQQVAADAAAVIGPAGGIINTPDDNVTIAVPPGDLTSETILTISYSYGDLSLGQIGKLIELGPDGLLFQSPVTLILKFDPVAIPGNVSENDLFIGRLGEFESWEILEGPQVDLIGKEVAVDITHLSTYGILYSVNADVSTFKLEFPLQGYTPYTVPISTVFDHSNATATSYKPDGKVVAFTGEAAIGTKDASGNYVNASVFYYPSQFGACYGFRSDNNTTYSINDHYTGANYLYYDGHPAFDYSVNGINVKAAASGKVVYAGWENANNHKQGFGQYVKIDHGNGYQTLYGHLSQIFVSVGETIQSAQLIGISGNSGNSSGAHLHFEVRYNFVPVDPYGWKGSYQDPYKVSNNYLWEGGSQGPWLSFIEGNPGIPGDGVLTNASYGYWFMLAEPIPLKQFTDGFTITVFPLPSDIADYSGCGPTFVAMRNGMQICGCHPQWSSGLWPTGNTIFGGIVGLYTSLPQSAVDMIIEHFNIPPGCNCTDVTANDVFLDGFILFRQSGWFFRTLDAAIVLPGQNAVP